MYDSASGGPRNFRGTRDYVGRAYSIRRWAIGIIAETFEQFGFQPLETPMIETEQTLRGKYGQEGEAGWFRLAGAEQAGLRFDQTVPLARFMAMNWNEFPLPFRRYVIGPVFRKETVQAGRYRQFTQCDFDTVGSSNPIIDAEVVAMNVLVLSRLGFTDEYQVQVNDRRLMNALAAGMGFDPAVTMSVFRAWDKLGKQTLDEVFSYFVEQLLDARMAGKKVEGKERASILATLQTENQSFLRWTEQLLELERLPADEQMKALSGMFPSNDIADALRLMDQLLNMVASMGVPGDRYVFRPLLARGLAYYTGPIFETVPVGAYSSITGGGRFDKLVEASGGPDLPASGSSFGLERLLDVMEDYGILPELSSVPAEVFAVVFDFNDAVLMRYLFEVVTSLRLTNLNIEVYTGDTQLKLGKQIDIARRKEIPLALIIGDEERKNGTATFKILSTGEQKTVPLAMLAKEIGKVI